MLEDRGKRSLESDINSEFISEASVSVFVRGQRREDNHSRMAEGSGSEPASVPPTTAPAATATVSYAKIAAVTSDNDPAAAVIVVNKEDTAASEAAEAAGGGEYQEERRQHGRGKKGKGGPGSGERAHRKEKGAKKKMQVRMYMVI